MGTFDLHIFAWGVWIVFQPMEIARHAATRQLTDDSTEVGSENAVTFDNPDFLFAKSRTLLRDCARGWRRVVLMERQGAVEFRFRVAGSSASRPDRYQCAASGRRDGNAHYKRSSKRELDAK